MELSADARIAFPRDVVFSAYRDDIQKVVPYLPNVRAIDVQSRREDGSKVEFVNHWRGGGDIPAAIRAVLSEAILSWTDYATWSGEEFYCDWRIETQAFTEAVRCGGRNRFVDEGPGKTLLQVRGALDIEASKIRGVPSFLAPKLGRAVEEFLVAKISANLVETATGLARYLEETRK